MKRPFAYIGITSLCAMTVFFYLGKEISLAVGAVALAVFLIFLPFKRLRAKYQIMLICFSLVLSSFLFCFKTAFDYESAIENYSSKTSEITAKLIDNPTKGYGYTEYLLETDSINGKDDSVKIELSSTLDLGLSPYDTLKCSLFLEKDDFSYDISRGIFLKAKVYDNFDCTVIKENEKPPAYYILILKNKLCDALDNSLKKPYSGFARAITLSDKSSLDKEIKEQFRTTGLSHIVVVSGIHMSIMSGALILLFKRIFNKRLKRLAYVFPILFELFYVFLTGFSPSVIRAALMSTIWLLSMFFFDRSDSLNSLGIAATVMLVNKPFYCGDFGFLLSFSATLGIILLSDSITVYCLKRIIKEKMPHLLKTVLKGIIAVISVTLSALIFTTPISVLLYGSISLVSLLSNLLVTPVIGVAIISAFLICIFYFVGFTPVVSLFALVFSVTAKYIFAVVSLISKIPFASVEVNSEYIYAWIIASFIIFLILFAVKKSFGFLRVFLPACALLLVFLSATDILLNIDKVTVEILPVGTGTTVTVKYGDSKALLCCGGAQSKSLYAIDEIDKSTDKISLLAVTGISQKSSRYAKELLNKFDVSQLLVYDNESVKQSFGFYFDKAKSVNSFTQKCTVRLCDKAKADFINVNGKVFVYLKTDNLTMLIIPPYGNCENIPDQYKKADIMVVNTAIKNDSLLQCGTLILSCTQRVSKGILDKTQIKRNTTYLLQDKAINYYC